jgi:hypothetical protein
MIDLKEYTKINESADVWSPEGTFIQFYSDIKIEDLKVNGKNTFDLLSILVEGENVKNARIAGLISRGIVNVLGIDYLEASRKSEAIFEKIYTAKENSPKLKSVQVVYDAVSDQASIIFVIKEKVEGVSQFAFNTTYTRYKNLLEKF